jgi:hypothetical protein
MDEAEPTPTSDLFATLVSTAVYATAPLLNTTQGDDWGTDGGAGNGTAVPVEDVPLPDPLDDGNYVLVSENLAVAV